jgi:gliding motility-associated-like protein
MKKHFLLFLYFLLYLLMSPDSHGQYATSGTGVLRNQLWWFDWSGITPANGVSKSFITHDGLNITITFSNVTNGNQLVPSQMNTWSGAVLHLLYNFTNSNVRPALFRSESAGGVTNISFTMTISATRNGSPASFTFIAADAEASTEDEVSTFTTSGSNWSVLEFFKNSSDNTNPLTGCGTTIATLKSTYGNAATTGQNPILATTSPASGTLTVRTSLDNTVSGGMAVAFGIFAPVDRGDLPGSFGLAQHNLSYSNINGCNYNPPLPAMVPNTRLKLGSVAGDADNTQTLNDNAEGIDEEALTSFPFYDGSGNYTITLPLENTTSSNAYLSAWFDYNRDGTFTINERFTAIIPPNTSNIPVTWAGLPQYFAPGVTEEFGFRFRLSSDQASVNNHSGGAPDGEVEDYFEFLNWTMPIVTSFFTTPDTVCINTPINIQNQSTNASSYYWNFCVSDITNIVPNAVNLGNPGGMLRQPVFSDFVEANGNYYVFVINHTPGALIRLDFGNSLLNTPAARNMGNFGGVLQTSTEGIQIVKEGSQWYGIIVGGTPASGTVPRIIKLTFGNDITTLTPAVTNWGNPGNSLSFPVDIHVFKENSNWYAFVVNSGNNTLTRIDFGANFSSIPTAFNFTVPDLSFPTGIFVMNNNNTWHAFVTNQDSRTLTRIDFGTSLLNNTPTSVNLGNPDNTLVAPRDLYILRSCNTTTGFLSNANSNTLVKLNFENGLEQPPTATTIGNVGNLDFPHSISKLFRVGNDLYSFITNVNSNTITRLQFAGCNNATIPSTTAQNPPPFTYTQPGTYNISLTVDDGLPTQASYCKPVVVLAAPPKNPVQQMTICPGQTITLEKNLPANITYTWNTGATTNNIDVTTPGIYWVDMTRFGCTTRDSFNVVNETADFSFVQDICNPLQVSFINETPQTTSITWSFGNGSTNNTDNRTTIFYNSPGTYIIKMDVITANGCPLSVQKELLIDITIDSLIINRDTTLCENSTLQLNSLRALSYCWFPAAGLSATNIANPIAVNPATPTTYYLHAQRPGSNLIRNGDFSQGNTGFSSSYTFAPNSGRNEGVYTISNNVRGWHSNFATCTDHTGGNGNMMLVNGAAVTNTVVWSQSITVKPNTNYVFSSWLQSLIADNPANLQFSINGIPLGSDFSAPSTTCQWQQFYTTWNAGNNTSAVIAIINKNTRTSGNDFALDDLSFAEVILYRDSITLQTERPVVTASVAEATICENAKTELNATGALTYSWSPASNLSNTQIVNPVASPKTTTTYTVTGTTVFGCTASDQVTVQVNPAPLITGITPDTAICKNTSLALQVNSNGLGFAWTNAASLSDPTIYNPVATPVQNSTKYIVTVTDAINCSNKDSVTLTWRPDPVFRITPNTTICDRDTITLSATGGERFNWQPAISLSSTSITNPKAFPGSTTTYAVTITDTVCNNAANLQTTITVNPVPVVSAIKDKDLDCSFGSAQLTAQGAIRYNWAPATGLNRTNIANPVASPITPMQYVVTGYNRYGCADTDTLQLNILTTNKGDNLMPNAFTPNNDGHNDCYGIKYWGVMEQVEFSIFNRWGQRVFYSNQADGCWDGTVKGIPQATGAYVYMINAVTNCGTISRKGTFVLIR